MQKVTFHSLKGGLLYAKRRPFTIAWQSSCRLRGCRFVIYDRLGAGGLLMTLFVVKNALLSLDRSDLRRNCAKNNKNIGENLHVR